MAIIRWPGIAVDRDANDLRAPVEDLLLTTDLLASEEDEKTGVTPTATPYSLQVISAGALALSKIVAAAIASGSVAAAAAAVATFYKNEEVPLRVALVAATGVLLASAVFGIAIIVRSDVQARSRGTAAQYAARASVTCGFLTTAASVQGDGVPTSPPAQTSIGPLLASLTGRGELVVTNSLGEVGTVLALRQTPRGALEVYMSQGDWVAASDVTTFTFTAG